jgi:phosphoglycerate dehydrogenase-like enzyme
MTSTVVVTAPPGAVERAIVDDLLSGEASVIYLSEVADDRRSAVLEEAAVLISDGPSEELSDAEFDRLNEGQTIQLLSAGVDHVSLDRLPDGMRVLNNAGAYAEPMAEHVLAMYLALAKRLLSEHRNMANGEFNQFTPTRWVDGSTVGIFGFGAIGAAVARLLQPLGASVMAINRSGETDESVAYVGTPDDLDRLLEACDCLVLTAPLTPETRGVIGREELSRMADDAILLNVARGELVDQADLYEHLRATPEFRAGLEAWWTEPIRHGTFELDYPFFELPNVLGSPHNSAIVPDVTERRTRHAVENVRAAMAGDPGNVVDRARGY